MQAAEQQGMVVKLDRGFPLVRTSEGSLVRCKHATALVKGENVRAVIGDHVVVAASDDADMAQIFQVLPRTRTLVRKDPSERALPQVLAANFDRIIVAHPLAQLNRKRLERELVLAHETGAQVAVALTKADLATAEDAATEALVRSIAAPGVEVLAVSHDDAASIEALRALIPQGTVAVLIGQSGAGKSSLVNLLAGAQLQATTPVRAGDGKGRHTTVSREMVPVPSGGVVVDMPGVRGLGMWEAEAGIEAAFSDVVELAGQCRFRDCTHENEPGCAVLAAVAEGRLQQERLESYRSLVAENLAQREAKEEADRIRSRRGHPRRRG